MLGCVRQDEIGKKKRSIIDSADEIESLVITDNMSSKLLSFLKERSILKSYL